MSSEKANIRDYKDQEVVKVVNGGTGFEEGEKLVFMLWGGPSCTGGTIRRTMESQGRGSRWGSRFQSTGTGATS